jgi:hypothetical protein
LRSSGSSRWPATGRRPRLTWQRSVHLEQLRRIWPGRSRAIINHPVMGVLCLGRIVHKRWGVNRERAVGEVIGLTRTCDHSVCDGAFLRLAADVIDNPRSILADIEPACRRHTCPAFQKLHGGFSVQASLLEQHSCNQFVPTCHHSTLNSWFHLLAAFCRFVQLSMNRCLSRRPVTQVRVPPRSAYRPLLFGCVPPS